MIGVGLSIPTLAAGHGTLTLAQQVSAFSIAHFDDVLSRAFQTNAGATPAANGDPVGLLTGLTGNVSAFQPGTGRRPVLTAAGWDFDGVDDVMFGFTTTTLTATSSFSVPDLADSIAGKGFTDTGISINADGHLVIINEGRANSADVTYDPSIVLVNATTHAKISEINLLALFESIGSVQDVAVDNVDGSYWICSFTEGLVRNVSAAGASVSSFASANCTGITINTATDELIVTDNAGTLRIFNKAGEQQATFALDLSDGIHYNPETGILFFAVEPASGTNYIGMFHLATRQYLGRLLVAEAVALESLVFDGTRMYVTSDTYFHSSTGSNEVLVYDLSAAPSTTLSTEITLWATVDADGAVANARAVAGFSSAGVTNAGAGMHIIASSTTGIRVFANTDVGTTERSFVDFTSLPDLTTPRAVVVKIDLTAKTVDLWVDGTAYGGTKSIPNVSGGIATDCFAIGGAKFVSDEFAGVSRAFGFASRFLNTGERAALDAYLAAKVAA